MLDHLVPGVSDYLHDRYVAGVADAENLYDQHAADEDSITGALGQSIASPKPKWFSLDGNTYQVTIRYTKLRGRGRDAPERLYGPDGVLQIEILDALGQVIRRKGLPFQAKNKWRYRSKALLEQAHNIQQEFGGGLVIDYRSTGYTACTCQEVIDADGRRTPLASAGKMRPLGQVLGNDFLACRVGHMDLWYDAATERFNWELRWGPRPAPAHMITTTVSAVRK